MLRNATSLFFVDWFANGKERVCPTSKQKIKRAECGKGKPVMNTSFVKFSRNEEALTTVEYAVGGALITLAITAGFQALGLQIGAVLLQLTATLGG